MPVYGFQSPEGQVYEVEAPEGATQEQAFEFFKQNYGSYQSPQPHAPAMQEQPVNQSVQPQQKASMSELIAGKVREKQISRASPRMQKGAVQQAQKEARVEEYLSSLPAEQAEQLRDMDYGERLWRGSREGVETFGRGIVNLLGGDWRRSPEEKAELERIAQSDSQGAYKLGEFAGELTPSLAGGLGLGVATKALSLGPKAAGALNVAHGGLDGAVIAEGKEKDPLAGAAMGVLGAGASQLVLPATKAIARKARNVGSRITPARNPHFNSSSNTASSELTQALNKEGLTIDDMPPELKAEISSISGDKLRPEEIARYALYKKEGLEPTRAMVTKNFDDASREADLQRVESGTLQRMDANAAVMQDAFNTRVNQLGEANRADNYVGDAVTARKELNDSVVNAAYERAAADAAAQGATVKPDHLMKVIHRLKAGGKDKRSVANDIERELKAIGVVDKKGKVVGRIKGENAEQIRKEINRLWRDDWAEDAERINPSLRRMKKAYDKDLDRDMTVESYKTARRLNQKAESARLSANINDPTKDVQKSLVNHILAGKINPDFVVDQTVFSRSFDAGQIKSLRKYMTGEEVVNLDKSGMANAGAEAFDSFRADVLQSIFDKSAIEGATGEGIQRLSAVKFKRTLKKIGDSKLAEIFQPEEIKFLKRNARMLDNIRQDPRTARGLGGVSGGVGIIEKMSGKLPIIGDTASKASQAIRQSVSDKIALSSSLREIAGAKPWAPTPYTQSVVSAISAYGVPEALEGEALHVQVNR